ncbi:MAG TPA: LptA/OstA family protein [Trichocoleus sp.]
MDFGLRRYRSLFFALGVLLSLSISGALPLFPPGEAAKAQEGGTITLRSDVQEANANTGIITARGNVQVNYPARDIYATAAQAQYFSNERRIVLSGDVVVLQEGNRLRAETVTYLVDEGRFVALPQPQQQVETIYQVPASPTTASPARETAPLVQPAPEPPSALDIGPATPSQPESSAPLNPNAQ